MYSLAGVYSLAGLATEQFIFRITVVCLWFSAVQLYLLWKESRGSQEKESGGISWIWEACGLTALVLGTAGTEGSREWLFFYLVCFAGYTLRFSRISRFRKGAFTLSAGLWAAAFWEQPFILWPEVIRMECTLLPVPLLLWAIGKIWGQTKAVNDLQTFGYTVCLVILGLNGIWTGVVWNALILEGICLAIFFWAQTKQALRWVRISGIIILLAALFMTRAFWLSISWWLYLLAAGIGLIVFAAVREKKHKGE